MKLCLLNDIDYERRFEELNQLRLLGKDEDAKLKYSLPILKKLGSSYMVNLPSKKTLFRKIGSCYGNAFRLMMDKGYQYVEGYVSLKGQEQKFSHAWNIDENGRHVDFTLRNSQEFEYFGIVIPNSLVHDVGFFNGKLSYCVLPYLELE